MTHFWQSFKQLQVLGFSLGDRIFIRCIAGKGFDVKDDKLYPFDGYLTLRGDNYSFTRFNSRSQIENGEPLEKFTVNDGYRYLMKENLKGYGVYLIPNMGGRKDEEITRCQSFFYECDDISKLEQWQRLKRLNLNPSLVIETRNSLHVYYRTVENAVEGWRKYQQRLIQLMDSDPSIHNESRLMRLAGFYHQKKGSDPLPIQIAYQSDAIYNINQFDERLPDWDNSRWGEVTVKESPDEIRQRLEQSRLRREQQLNSIDSFPLEICLSKDDRDLIAHGVSQGGRNANGFKLASNLIATENWLTYAGYHFTDTANDLFNEFCDRCSPPIGDRERHQIWLSASRGNPTPSLPDEAIENCIRAWQWNQLSDEEKAAFKDKKSTFNEPDQTYFDYLKEQERVENAIASENRIERFKHKLSKAAKRVKKRVSSFIEAVKSIDFTENRAKAWLENDGDILDRSFMGSGKNHAVPTIENFSGKIWFISQDHRNPSVKAIEERFTDLIPRSQYGFARIDGKLVEATEETLENELEIKPNCIRANLFRNLANKGYQPDIKENGKENPICATCPIKGVCVSQEGYYRHDRREALSNPKQRCDIQAMPRDYDYSQDIVIIDEPSQNIKPIKNLESDWGNLLLELDRVRDILPDEDYRILDSLLQQIKPLFTNKERYGLIHQSVIELVDFSLINLNQIIDLIESNPLELSEIFKESDAITLSKADKRKYGDLLEYATSKLRGEAYKESLDLLEKVPPNALINVLKAFRGDKGISLRVIKGKLQITIDNRDSYAFLGRAKKIIYLDATITPERLQTIMGLNRLITTIQEKIDKPLNNLTLYQIKTEGIGSKQVSDTAINRVRELIKRLGEQFGDIPLITHKCLTERLDIDGYWFKDNRGSNDFAGFSNLMALGLPNPNVGAIEDEKLALEGDLDEFEGYYRKRVNDEILQLAGRQRCHRYSNQKFNLFMITPLDADLSWLKEYGCKIVEVDAVEICPQAGNRYQVALLNIAKAIQETGARTQSAIAQHLGVSRQAISKLLRDNGLNLSEIIERVNCQPTLYEPNKDGLTVDALVNSMRDLLDLDPIALAKEVIDCIKSVGWQTFYDTWFKDWPEPLQHKAYGILWVLLTTEEGGYDL